MFKKPNVLIYVTLFTALLAVIVSLSFYFDYLDVHTDDWMLYPNHSKALTIAEKLLEESQQALPATERNFYQVMSVDLSKNGHFEHIILINHPYYCGSGGCTLFIYNASIKQLQAITGIHAPISMQLKGSGKFPDLFGWSQSKLRHLVSEHRSGAPFYPQNASIAPTLKQLPPDTITLIPSL
jgi:hypothetical protein